MVSDKLVIETVALTDVSLLVQIACREQVYKIDPSLQHIAFPLLAEGRVFAVMEIFHEQIITNEQVQIFEIFAMQTSSVLENRHLKMELEDSNKKLRCISMHDGLTGVFNRRWFDEILEKDWQRAKQQQQPVALIMLDVDCFKMYNDTYGHLAGDQVLKKVAACLHNCTNGKRVLPARYGGEEFVVLLPGVSAAEAENIAENLRLQIEKLAIENKNSVAGPNLTISLGVNCLLPCKGENAANLIGGADAALYQAKTSGRNRVVVAESAFVCYSY